MSNTAQYQNVVDSNLSTTITPSVSDPQVKAKKTYAPRRRFDSSYKQRRILLAYEACSNASERGALLRGERVFIMLELQPGGRSWLKVN